MPYENVIMGLMLFVCVMFFSVFLWFSISAIKMDDKIFAIVGFLVFICLIVLSLTFLEYFGIVQLGILH